MPRTADRQIGLLDSAIVLHGDSMKKHALGITAVLVGAAALALGILAEAERDWLQDKYEQRQKERTPSRNSSIQIGPLSVKIGNKAEPEEPVPLPPKFPPLWVATLAAGVLGLVLAVLSWVREKRPSLSGAAISLCAAGLLWHYVAIGVTVAVAIFVLAAILGTLN
jgi:hypothetical protein